MSNLSANPVLHEYDLMTEIGISPTELEDQYIQLPSFKDVIKWFFGKPIRIMSRSGVAFDKFQSYLTILDGKRSMEKTEMDKNKREFS